MQHVEVVRRFSAPPQAVWGVYTDHAGWSAWSGIRNSSLAVEGSPDRNGNGAVRVFGQAPVLAHEEILDFEPPRRMTYRVIRGGLPMRHHLGEVLFEPNGTGTRVTWRCRFDPAIPGLGWLFRIIVARVFRSALEGLARHSFPDQAD
jgi:uncharacterized protein YndB with AHSA1/START domain